MLTAEDNRNDRSSIQNAVLHRTEDLCALVEKLGFGGKPEQLMNPNGSFLSSLGHFFDQNPAAMESVRKWIEENHDFDGDEP